MSYSTKDPGWADVAPGWLKHDHRAVQKDVTAAMLASALVRAGHKVLDIASGTGEPAITAAHHVGPTGAVVGIDLSSDMLQCARQKAETLGLSHLQFQLGDGQDFVVPDLGFDAVLIRWGLMFMADPDACLRRARAALKPTGHISVACWAAPAENPWASIPMDIIRQYESGPEPMASGIFSFADRGRLHRVLEDAGFVDVRIQPVRVFFGDVFAHVDDFMTYLLDVAGPVTRRLCLLSAEQQQHARDEMRRAFAAYSRNGQVLVPGITWVGAGRR